MLLARAPRSRCSRSCSRCSPRGPGAGHATRRCSRPASASTSPSGVPTSRARSPTCACDARPDVRRRQRSRPGALALRLRLRAGPLPGHELPAPLRRQLLAARPADATAARGACGSGAGETGRRARRHSAGARLSHVGARARAGSSRPPGRDAGGRAASCAGAPLSSFALIDSHGRLHGLAPRRRYITRQRGQGDAAGGLPAPGRQPRCPTRASGPCSAR